MYYENYEIQHRLIHDCLTCQALEIGREGGEFQERQEQSVRFMGKLLKLDPSLMPKHRIKYV